MRVVGRDREIAAIDRDLDKMGRGFAAIVISGDPGIGKTTLWRHGVTAAQARDFQVICCRPAESEIWLSFSGLADLIAEVPAELVDTLPGPQRDALEVALLKQAAPESGTDHRAISTAVTSVMRNLVVAAPVVIAVDDLQWLDAATAGVLAYMLRRLAGEPVMLLATIRDSQAQPLPAGLGQLDGDLVRHVWLGPLAARELRELVRNVTGLTLARPELLRLHEASGGNPLLAVEIARALDRSGTHLAPGEPLPVPKSVAALVTEHISALPPANRTALLVASALAHPTVGQIQAAMSADGELSPSADEGLLDDAEDYGVVHIRDGVVSFAHPLYSSAIYSAVPPARRRRMHRLLAEIVHSDEERAWHMALAEPGPDSEVAAAVEKAAGAAQARGALQTAARLWELAGRRTPDSDPESANRRTMGAAMCLFKLGDGERAISMLEALIEAMPPGHKRAQVLLWLATILYHQSSSVRAAALCRQALAEAGDDRLLRARLHLRAAWFTQYDTAARARHAEEATVLVRGVSHTAEPDLLVCTDMARGYYRFLAGHGLDSCDLDWNHDLLNSGERSWERAWGLYLACQWTKSLDLPRAHAYCLTALQQGTDSGDEFTIAHTLFHLAEIECWLGQLDRAKEHAAEAAAGFELTGQGRWRGLGLYIKALTAAYLGDVDTASTAAKRGLEVVASDDDPYVSALLLGTLGFTALTVGELVEADRHLSRADQLVSSMGLAEPARHRFHGDYMEIVLARGDLARADVLQRQLEDRVRVAPYPWLSMITARGRALLDAARCDLDASAHAIQQALCHAQAAAMPFEHARTLLAAGRIRRRRKEKTLAREALLQAQEIFDAVPNALWAAQVTGETRRLGLRGASPHDLTPTEERIARLAADGQTNAEIAGTLHISKKTVEANLSRVFRKLRINSRRELTEAWPEAAPSVTASPDIAI